MVAAIICKNDKIFVTQRASGDYRGMWEFPRGNIELGESPETAVVRKIKEKLSVSIQVGKWVGNVEYDYQTFHMVLRTYLCTISYDELKENNAAKWVALSELGNIKWEPGNAKLVANIRCKLGEMIRDKNWNCKYKGDYYAYVSDGVKTLPLMNDFEGRSEKTKGPYKRFILSNTHETIVGNYMCRYHLILERISDVKYTKGNITFSEFKKEKGASVYQYCNIQLREAVNQDENILNQKEFYFITPFYLRAQNSGNREGYGWKWEWTYNSTTSTEGTFYGETDNYGFVGVIIESVKKRAEFVQKMPFPTNLGVELTTYQGKKYYKIYETEEESFLIPYKNGMSRKDALRIYYSIQQESIYI